MSLLNSEQFFPSATASISVEPRNPQPAFPEHSHDFYEIFVVEKGSGTHVLNGHPYVLCRGSVCFIRDKDQHLFEDVDQLTLTNLLFRSPRQFRFLNDIETLLPYGAKAHGRINDDGLTQVRQRLAMLQNMAAAADPQAIAGVEACFLELVLQLRQCCLNDAPSTQRDDRVQALLQWLQHHFREDIEWADVADQFSLALRTLHRHIKQTTGLTPQRYLNRLRLLEARRQLLESDTPITEIAYNCGFHDSNHFSTLFRREFQLPPRAIRSEPVLDS